MLRSCCLAFEASSFTARSRFVEYMCLASSSGTVPRSALCWPVWDHTNQNHSKASVQLFKRQPAGAVPAVERNQPYSSTPAQAMA